jgi:aspartate carbamoyltransferase
MLLTRTVLRRAVLSSATSTSSTSSLISSTAYIRSSSSSSYEQYTSYYIPLSRNTIIAPSLTETDTTDTPVTMRSPTSTMMINSTFLPSLTEDPTSWKGQSLVSVTQITPRGFELLVKIATQMKDIVLQEGGDDRFKHKLLATVFYEASTRTSCSFQAAMQRLGGKILHVDGQGNSSAGKKKESLEDTIRCLECYVDAVVLRHPVTGSVPAVYHSGLTKPLVNAGDGIGEHPTQALLDTFTIWDELKSDPKLVVFLGDLKHGRTVHSLAKLLAQLRPDSDLILRFCSPTSLSVPSEVLDYCDRHGVRYEQYDELTGACCEGAQVLYVTRIQKERFESEEEYNSLKGSYVVDTTVMDQLPHDMIVLHPLPRVDEICPDVDADPRAAYFRQMENGMYVRMALLALLLGKPDP